LLRLREDVGLLEAALNPDFVQAAAAADASASVIALRWLTHAAPVPPKDLATILTSVAKGLGSAIPQQSELIRRAFEANRSSLPLTEQVAAMVAGTPQLAEAIATTAGLRGDILAQLFSLAKRSLKREPVVAARRLAAAERWSGEGGNAARTARKAYADLLKEAQSADQLRIVLESLIRFFPTADDVPDLAELRRTGLAAIERLSASIDGETAALVDEVITTLRWDVSRTAAAVNRIRSKLGI
jgi:hypothetical protein